MLLLYFAKFSIVLPIIGLLAFIFYNLLYTPLKQKTIMAILPGAICGMLSPLIGWLAAGGDFIDRRIILVMVIFGLWQIPHFWLILLFNSDEYRQSSIPNMLKKFSLNQLKRFLFVWGFSYSVTTLLFPLFKIINSIETTWLITLNSILFCSTMIPILFFNANKKLYKFLFIHLNASITVFMGLIFFEQVF